MYRFDILMSSPMHYRPPLIRQILPWLFALLFLITAPLLIFYTSGYRYNVKKGLIERNGTLIVDSTPAGADIFIDDQNIQERTPITLQNIVPGWHTVRVQRSRYSSWQETVLIRPERVTFANSIWLWRQAEPEQVWTGDVRALRADPLGDHAILLSATNAGLTWQPWTPNATLAAALPLIPSSSSSIPLIKWSSDGLAAILHDESSLQSWWMHTTSGRGDVEALPRGNYHWAGTELIGNSGSKSIRINTSKLAITSIPHEPAVVETSQGIQLQTSPSSTNHRVLIDTSFLTRRYALPPGQWSLAEVLRPYILLRQHDDWLGVQLKFGQPYAETVHGDYPRFAPQSEIPRAAFLHGSELWLWPMGGTPSLLWRQSESLVQAAWHRSGDYLFVADRTHVFALALDGGNNQRVTPLADFTTIHDITVLDRVLYVAGKKDGQSGIWKLSIE